MKKDRQYTELQRDSLRGCINRMSVTNDLKEIELMTANAIKNIHEIAAANTLRLEPTKYTMLPCPVSFIERDGICPHCKQRVFYFDKDENAHHCPHCGQMIIWTEATELPCPALDLG